MNNNIIPMRKTTHQKQSKSIGFHKLPIRISEKRFTRHFLPFLTLPERGFTSKIPLYKIFNYILYQLHTGCQWEELPIALDLQTGKPEISYVSVWRWFNRWAHDRSFEVAFINSVKELRDRKKLRLKRIHGDGTNSVAKKGAKVSDILDTSIRKDRRSSQ